MITGFLQEEPMSVSTPGADPDPDEGDNHAGKWAQKHPFVRIH